jgi:hypothetical protein
MTGDQRPGSSADNSNRQGQDAGERDRSIGGNRPMGGDPGKVGTDTADDGKMVRPGQSPRQSPGPSMPDKR